MFLWFLHSLCLRGRDSSKLKAKEEACIECCVQSTYRVVNTDRSPKTRNEAATTLCTNDRLIFFFPWESIQHGQLTFILLIDGILNIRIQYLPSTYLSTESIAIYTHFLQKSILSIQFPFFSMMVLLNHAFSITLDPFLLAESIAEITWEHIFPLRKRYSDSAALNGIVPEKIRCLPFLL